MKNLLTILAITSIFFSKTFAQDNDLAVNNRAGYRIATTYWGIGLSAPMGGLKGVVPAGIGTKLGTMFYFYKPGFAKGLINVGLNATFLNAEANVPFSKLSEKGTTYSLGFSSTYGPTVTFNPVGEFYIDAYYQIGAGFRLFPGSGYYSDYYYSYYGYGSPFTPHLALAQNVGINLRWKALFANCAFNMINNNNYYTGASRYTTFQLNIGVCARIK